MLLKTKIQNKNLLLISALILTIAVGVFTTLYFLKKPHLSDLQKQGSIGEAILKDFSSQPLINISENENNYQIKDILRQGVTIQYASLTEEQKKAQENEPKDELNIELPKNYNDPINIKLDEQRIISITDKNGNNFSDKLITEDVPVIIENQESRIENQELNNEEQKEIDVEQLAQPTTQSINYLKYQDKSKRKAVYYAYQKEPETRNLKHWTIYQNQNKKQTEEKETYQISNAKLKLNAKGEIEVFYFGEKDIQNEQVKAEVAPSLLERAQRTLQKELGEDILNSEGYTPDFIIPTPYYLNKNQETKPLKWELNQETNEISVNFTPQKDEYPIALDPTLQFTAPGQSSSGNTINIDASNSSFGYLMSSGNFNDDDRVDLAVGVFKFAADTGRVYIFYNDGSIPTTAITADVIITGGAKGDSFGYAIGNIDLNNDGDKDLIIGAPDCLSSGRVYIFYNDGSISAEASEADIIIMGETSSDFGTSLASGDFNYDGIIDLAVGAYLYPSVGGRVYIFYNDGLIPTTVATADVIISGEVSYSYFGKSMVSGDFNADGRVDLAVGAESYSSQSGRIYIFYNDGSYPTTAATADVVITGETNSYFGCSLASGDFDYDGDTDLAAGAYYYNSGNGRVYIFYNDGSIPTTAATADTIITEIAGSRFGNNITSGDFNADGRTDLAAGGHSFSGNDGRVCIFYNDGAYPTAVASADVIILGEDNSLFGFSVASGDFNYDGRVDLAAGAYNYLSTTGRAYIFYNDGSIPTTAATADVTITGESDGKKFASSMIGGDFNADGKTDLAVGSPALGNGKVYVFYSDTDIISDVTDADLIIYGEASAYNMFGAALWSMDLNSDGKSDLVVTDPGYSLYTGRAYIFYNDGSISTTAASADVTILGQSGSQFGEKIIDGDLNSDGKNDLIISAEDYSSSTGRVYIFYNDGSIPTTAATANVIITGQAGSNYFGGSFAKGDFNADGRVDLAVGANGYSNGIGRAYIFYNDGSIPTTAATANVIISGVLTFNYFGISMSSADFNNDNREDLVVATYRDNSTQRGDAYIFYNDGSYPTSLSSANFVINGEYGAQFGDAMTTGDFNADGKTDLAVGGDYYSNRTGRVYVFYNDGSIPTAAESADVIIAGENKDSDFGKILVSADFNNDGKTDLGVGAPRYLNNNGRAYVFYSRNGQISADVIIAGNSLNKKIGDSFTSGDFNNDGRTDLVVSAFGTSHVYIFYNDGSIPTTTTTADVIITGETVRDFFGSAVTRGDFDYDGDVDLAVSTSNCSYNTGRAYIFYNDGSIPTTAAAADVIINGEAASSFGSYLTSGDFNYDSRVDLAVGAYNYSSGTGRAYIFYNDGSIPTTAATANVIITGEATSNYFGDYLTSGDFNYDSRVDLAVGAYNYSSGTGRAYIFYNDGSIPTTAATADVIITGESWTSFTSSMTSGDFNADGRVDLAVGARNYSSSAGRAYIFYNDGSIPTTAASADVIINGEAASYFGSSMTNGDFNYDGTIDLSVGASSYSSQTGRIYIFYNDGSIPTSAASADVIITGEESGGYFGDSMASGDFNADGKNDLVVGAYNYSTYDAGRVYIFYNDGAYPSVAASAELIIRGDEWGDFFGSSLVSGDLNHDGLTDLVVGASGYNFKIGKLYIFYNDGSYPSASSDADATISGENENDYFGSSFATGDLNNDNQTDLIVGAYGNNANTGKVYIFYNDGSYPSLATDADIKITGENTNDYFGYSLTTGNITGDSHTDLIIGANGYSTNTGRSYIFNNDGSIPTTASSADNIITGQNTNDYFGSSLIAGDFDYDMDNDLAVGAYGYNTNTGRAYIFNNDSSYPTLATDSDIKIDGEGTNNYFSEAFTSGDFNNDGRLDLVVGAKGYQTNKGRTYIFNNDGSIPLLASGADDIILGEFADGYFGKSMATGDFNADGKIDLAVGAHGSLSLRGCIYVFSGDGDLPVSATLADARVTGNSYTDNLGYALIGGDFNSDKKMDLAIGEYDLLNAGGFYIFNMDISESKPDYVKSRGGFNVRGSVKVR